MAAYDLPCTIEYVRRHTNGQAVALVAHSQGAALSLASLASGAIPPGHVKLLITLAPAVFLKYIDSVPLQFLASVHADTLFKSAGAAGISPDRLENCRPVWSILHDPRRNNASASSRPSADSTPRTWTRHGYLCTWPGRHLGRQ